MDGIEMTELIINLLYYFSWLYCDFRRIETQTKTTKVTFTIASEQLELQGHRRNAQNINSVNFDSVHCRNLLQDCVQFL